VGTSRRKTPTAGSDGRQYKKRKIMCSSADSTAQRAVEALQQLEYAVNGAVGEAVTDTNSNDVINPIILRSRRLK
jgi:hypothetical protein